MNKGQNIKTRTRIAPSPTGLFHIGTARTALVNYIFAKQNKGEFLLRMEDTDAARNKPEYEEDIKNGLTWLCLKWEGEIVYQKNRVDRYREIVDELVKKGAAYKKDGAVWFKIPPGMVKFTDLIRGEVEFDSKDIKDFVVTRSDNSPIFYLSGVVDDHDSQITHVIRGEEHLSNTPKQILLLQALGWCLPTYAHLPLILNPDRSKMSKRKDPVSITRDFKQNGYLPEAMINYLALLGWHPSENLKSGILNLESDADIYRLDELIKFYNISKMQHGGAVFDIEKLDSINHHYIQKMSDTELGGALEKYRGDISKDIFAKFISITKPRLKKLADITQDMDWLKKPVAYDPSLLIFKKSTTESTLTALRAVQSTMLTYEVNIKVDEINGALEQVVKENNLTNGDVFWSVRVALSGLEKSPPPAEMMWVIGKEETTTRIKKAIGKLKIKN